MDLFLHTAYLFSGIATISAKVLTNISYHYSEIRPGGTEEDKEEWRLICIRNLIIPELVEIEDKISKIRASLEAVTKPEQRTKKCIY